MDETGRIGDFKAKIRRPLAILNVHGLKAFAEIKKARHSSKTAPLDPPFHGGFIEVVKDIRRQFGVAAVAVEFEDAVGRGGLGVESRRLREKGDET